jgi:predicted RNase H-like HicB family nuclease
MPDGKGERRHHGYGPHQDFWLHWPARKQKLMNFTLDCEQEADGRWIAEVPELPGVLAYGNSQMDAMSKAKILALRVIADRLENGESEPFSMKFSVAFAA